ncbi:MAG: hypothetical protein HFF14_10085 [Angelakisella sp.]|jgi:hypothetical protein|nr:hypothetical protein [Angelakisella sp.]
MTDQELRMLSAAIQSQLADAAVPDEVILDKVREVPELLQAKLPSSANLFLAAVSRGRFQLAKELAAMGADIHWRCEASGIGGNALNAARTPEQAEELLAMGLEIERNLSLRLPCQNPAVTSASRNEPEMMRYWLQKQSQLFAGEPEYLQQLFYAAIRVASMLNQYNTLAVIMADDELFPLLREIYSREDTVDSIKLYQSALRRIKDESLEPRKKELRKILNARKKELSQ